VWQHSLLDLELNATNNLHQTCAQEYHCVYIQEICLCIILRNNRHEMGYDRQVLEPYECEHDHLDS
jgi:hypothetical protein